MTNLLVGMLTALVIALAAYRTHSLTRTGAIAAFAVGSITFGVGALGFAAVLLAFFLSSIVLSRIGRARKKQLVDIGKSGARDAWQVLANGGVATLAALGTLSGSRLAVLAFAGAYAAATADTWGTEIGTLVRGLPRSIFTLRPIATGLSGGITLAGTLAEIAGACTIAIIATAVLFGRADRTGVVAGIAIAIGGTAGAFIDSALGASLQELRRCDRCERTCETNPHACGSATQRVRGVAGFSNDVVNALATLSGALIAPTVFLAIGV
jgi:uncharacterized protein (TIGR00297 family)